MWILLNPCRIGSLLRRSIKLSLENTIPAIRNNHGLYKREITTSSPILGKTLDISKIAFIGGGNMAEAMINGIIKQNLLDKSCFIVSDPNPLRREIFSKMNIKTVERNRDAVTDADTIVLAIKPQTSHKILSDIATFINPKTLIISILAGITMEGIQHHFGPHVRLVRAMPNTPAMIGEGTTVWTQSLTVNKEQHDIAKNILGSFGVEVFADDENNLDMATALSGSGPVAEAMVDAGVHMGFPRHVATKLVQQTMLGSALYLKQSDCHPVILRNNITSPGGTTAAAMYRAEKNGFRAVLADSIWAAYERSRELGSTSPIERKRPRS